MNYPRPILLQVVNAEAHRCFAKGITYCIERKQRSFFFKRPLHDGMILNTIRLTFKISVTERNKDPSCLQILA
jgi:hypothetical protein